ncbi:1629_t:CDS:2, partial [Entrophospora sp. SA101]
QDDDSSSFSTLPLSSFIKVDDLLDVLKKTNLPSCPLEPCELYDYLKKFYGDEDSNEAIGQTTCKEAQRKPESDNSFNNNNPRFVPLEISNKILGYGANGSIVYKGRFEGKDVAIKRLLLDYYKLAHHEVSLLQESDEHANIIRYYCTQQCENFFYIAIELCEDFGLCKKLEGYSSSFNISTNNISGTLGWRAPELSLLPQQPPNNRITKAVDIFSAGCLFYYVISGDEIQRYSPARRFYLCSFMGEEGDEKLRNLLGNKDWAIRYYDNNQYAYMDIINNQIKVVWKEVGLVEANGSSISSSNIIISFSIDKGSH